MNSNFHELQNLLAEMAVLLDKEHEPDPQLYGHFFQHPEYAFQLIELLNNLDEQIVQEGASIYSACIFAFDVCVAQLQAAVEMRNKVLAKSLPQLMARLAELIRTRQHSLSYWLPVLNAFYEVNVELSLELKEAYFNLMSEESEAQSDEIDEFSHLESIRDLIAELSDLSVFEIAEHFFAQSYAMPPDFFADLLMDLYSIPEGHDIALLALLHPKADVREVVIATMEQLIDQITLSSVSLSRIQTIKYWYPESYHERFERWIKIQRKKEVVFVNELQPATIKLKATEIDGSGSQGIFIHSRKKRKHRLGGLLFKYNLGIKDTWITLDISAKEISEYYHQAFDESVTLRDIDIEYFRMMCAHFLALSMNHGEVPNVQFLDLQEELGIRLRPKLLDINELFTHLSVEIMPFTQETINESLKRTKKWLKNKQFTESWYIENSLVDKIVNHNSSFINGTKVCRLEDAMANVFAEEMELNRDKWQFHFLWIALWLKAKERKNEKSWKDSFIIAHLIREGRPLSEIPVMSEICRQTVINSIETMHERKTHLNQE